MDTKHINQWSGLKKSETRAVRPERWFQWKEPQSSEEEE